MHLYDLKETSGFKINNEYLFPIQNCKTPNIFENDVWFIDLDNYYRHCFCVELENFETIEKYAQKSWSIFDYFSQNDIPHNAVFVKSKSFRNQKETIKCFIWPKISSNGKLKLDSFFIFVLFF